jgi:hypothetical protein
MDFRAAAWNVAVRSFMRWLALEETMEQSTYLRSNGIR